MLVARYRILGRAPSALCSLVWLFPSLASAEPGHETAAAPPTAAEPATQPAAERGPHEREARQASEESDATAPGPPPNVFLDAGLRGKLWPRAGLLLLGPVVGAIARPFDKCVHLTAEGGVAFASLEHPTDDPARVRTATLALGAIWGAGTEQFWFGAGAVLDGGWSAYDTGEDTDNSFELDAALRAQLRGRLRKIAWVFAEVRLGHALVADASSVSGGFTTGQSGPMVGLVIGGSVGL